MGTEWFTKVTPLPCSSRIQIEEDDTIISDEQTPLIFRNERIDVGYFLLGFLLIFLIVGGSIGTYLLIRQEFIEDTGASNYRNYLVSRDEWSIVEPNGTVEPIPSPITYILLTETARTTCLNKEDCIEAIRNLQKEHMINGTDINYNFLMGGDGLVYEGLGWHRTKSSNMTTPIIALLGSFSDYEPTEAQKDNLKALIRDAKNNEIIANCYFVAIRYDQPRSFSNIIDLSFELEQEKDFGCPF